MKIKKMVEGGITDAPIEKNIEYSDGYKAHIVCPNCTTITMHWFRKGISSVNAKKKLKCPVCENQYT